MDLRVDGQHHDLPSPVVIGISEFAMMRTGDPGSTSQAFMRGVVGGFLGLTPVTPRKGGIATGHAHNPFSTSISCRNRP